MCERLSFCYMSNSHDLLVTTKKVKSIPLPGVSGQTRMAIAAFLEFWAPYITASELLVSVKPLIVKGRKPAENPSLTARTIDHTGTCGCCQRNIKMTDGGRIWDHGYTIDGRGRGVGSSYKNGNSCFGVGYEPIEISPRVWKDLLVRMEARIKDLPKRIEQAKEWLKENPKPVELPYYVREDSETPEAQKYRKTWVARAQGHREMKSELSHLTTAIPLMIEALQTAPGAARHWAGLNPRGIRTRRFGAGPPEKPLPA